MVLVTQEKLWKNILAFSHFWSNRKKVRPTGKYYNMGEYQKGAKISEHVAVSEENQIRNNAHLPNLSLEYSNSTLIQTNFLFPIFTVPNCFLWVGAEC